MFTVYQPIVMAATWSRGTQITQDFRSVGVHTMNIVFFSKIMLNHVQVFKIQGIARLRRSLNVYSAVCDEATNQ